MPVAPKKSRVNIIPCLRYRDAPAAIAWLCATFSFEEHLVVAGENNTIVHAQLSFGNGMIMLGSTARVDNDYGKLITQPEDIGGGHGDRHGHQGRRLRRARFHLPRHLAAPLEFRHLRPVRIRSRPWHVQSTSKSTLPTRRR